jgi:hypothetical protein
MADFHNVPFARPSMSRAVFARNPICALRKKPGPQTLKASATRKQDEIGPKM